MITTRQNHVCVTKAKSQFFCHFVIFLNKTEQFTEKHMKILKSDQGGGVYSNEFSQDLSGKVLTPEQYPLSSERLYRSLLEQTHNIMIDTR